MLNPGFQQCWFEILPKLSSMASYKANNLVIESPAFERCIFIYLSVINWSFFLKKKLTLQLLNPGFQQCVWFEILPKLSSCDIAKTHFQNWPHFTWVSTDIFLKSTHFPPQNAIFRGPQKREEKMIWPVEEEKVQL